jgi:hypothetical protein
MSTGNEESLEFINYSGSFDETTAAEPTHAEPF